MAGKWLCPKCQKNLSHQLGHLAQMESPCCPYCQAPLDPGAVWHAEGEAATKVGCGIGSLIMLGGWGAVGYLAANYPAFANIDVRWRWLTFAVPLVAGIAAMLVFGWFAERRREKRRQQE